MANELAIQLLELFERKVNETVKEAKALLSYDRTDGGTPANNASAAARREVANSGTWYEVNRKRGGASQRWPDGSVDTYDDYVVYRCDAGPFDRVELALGWVGTRGKEGEIVGFLVGAGGRSKRPLTVFFPADDFATSNERLSMIRGKDGSRKGYAPHEQLPAAYEPFTISVLGQRISGKWNVKAVVASDDEAGIEAMLNHTAIQAETRGLI